MVTTSLAIRVIGPISAALILAACGTADDAANHESAAKADACGKTSCEPTTPTCESCCDSYKDASPCDAYDASYEPPPCDKPSPCDKPKCDAGCSCEPCEKEKSCTLTQGYWKNHNAYGRNRALKKPWPISENTLLCGKTWYDILWTPPGGDAWFILAHQWIAAKLNVASGASTTNAVDEALYDGEQYLNLCKIPWHKEKDALSIAALLDKYNNGRIGPGHCD